MPPLFTSFALMILAVTVYGSSAPGAHAFESDVLNTEGVCTKRILTCKGKGANIEVNKSGIISNPATLIVTCNHGGTAWETAGVAVTQVECSSSK